MKTIIIGGVAGGATTVARLRRQDENAEIILFERGEYISYANCGLPYYIGNTITSRDALFVQTVDGFKNRFKIDIRVKTEVTAINKKEKNITAKDLTTGEVYTDKYDKLVISTGAEPIKPPIEGIDNNKIFSLRNVPDMDKIKKYVNDNNIQKAVVIGGGFIGLEMVENLHQLGIEISLIERNNQVMTPIDYSMAAIVHQELKNKNISLFFNENVIGFEDDNDSINVKLESKKTVNTDMVILSIGVKPETKLSQDAGLEHGSFGGIKVNEYLQTSDKDIYALGDAIEVWNPVIDKYMPIPLAGPANKQGRIVADNLTEGNQYKYIGTIGTSIAKVFDLTVATTGVSAKVLERENIAYIDSYTHSGSHAGYYPKALPMSIKISFSPKDGRLLGAQVVGFDGVDKRIDLFASVIKKNGNIHDLMEIEHAYAPPYSSAKDPVNIAGFVADNILKQKVKIVQWHELSLLDPNDYFLIDTRTKDEHEMGYIPNAINIPVDELRYKLNDIPKGKKVIVYCAVGLRGYLASRILYQNGFSEVYNLSGGYKTYSISNKKQTKEGVSNNTKEKETKMETNANTGATKTVSIDACGLQCPGPIMQLKKNYDSIKENERIEIKVTDQAFGEDLKGWCKMVGANLVDINSNNGVISAIVEKTSQQSNVKTNNQVNDGKTIVVFSDDMDKALASFVIANGAAATGKKVSLFFTFWGLNVIKKINKPTVEKDFLGKMFGMMLPANSKKLPLSKMNMGGMGSKMMKYIMQNKKIDSLESLMQQAIDNGVEMIACSMSMEVMGIKQDELLDNVTIGGVAAYLSRAEESNVNLFI